MCPVFIGDIDSEEPFLEPRHWAFGFLLEISAFIYQVLIFIAESFGAEADGFPLHVTGRLEVPKVICWESE